MHCEKGSCPRSAPELLTFYDPLEGDEPSNTKMEWLERKKENQERILSHVMETKEQGVARGGSGQQCRIPWDFKENEIWKIPVKFRDL